MLTKRPITLVVTLIGLILVPVEIAWADTAMEMASKCRFVRSVRLQGDMILGIPPTLDAGECLGAFGVIQDFSRYIDGQNGRVLHICSPRDSRLTQFALIFLNYVDQHPETAHEEFSQIALQALTKAWPCK